MDLELTLAASYRGALEFGSATTTRHTSDLICRYEIIHIKSYIILTNFLTLFIIIFSNTYLVSEITHLDPVRKLHRLNLLATYIIYLQ